MTDLERLPVVIGAGQHTNRIDDPDRAPHPFEMLETVARAAAADAGGGRAVDVLRALTHVWVLHSLSIRHADPAGELARRLGVDASGRYTGLGGNMPQWLVNRAAEMVLAGERPLVLIAGVEALATLRRFRERGQKPPWPKREGAPELWPPQEPDMGVHPAEAIDNLPQPTHMYAVFETAIAHAEARPPGEHRDRMGRLFEAFNAVAAANPHSWFPTRRSAEELVTPAPDNRMVCYPYTKYLNAVMNVDMAAAVLVTDAATARALGLDPAGLAYLTGWADAKECWYVSSRPSLADSPAAAEACRAALDQARCSVEDVTAFDLYACFPSSVELVLRGLGLEPDDPRPFTLTGGLPFHGGPGNNYVTHAIANTLAHLREHPGTRVLVHGNGYYATKHAVGLYQGREPAEVAPPDPGVQDRVDATSPPLPVRRAAEGTGTVVGYTVPFERDAGPRPGLLIAEVDGVRTVAVADEELTAAFLEADAVGTPVKLTAGDEAALAAPA